MPDRSPSIAAAGPQPDHRASLHLDRRPPDDMRACRRASTRPHIVGSHPRYASAGAEGKRSGLEDSRRPDETKASEHPSYFRDAVVVSPIARRAQYSLVRHSGTKRRLGGRTFVCSAKREVKL